MTTEWKPCLAGFLRVELDIEVRGLDIKKHGEPAYPTAAYGHGWDTEGDFRMSNLKANETVANENASYEDYKE